jgi:hypothetical protein
LRVQLLSVGEIAITRIDLGRPGSSQANCPRVREALGRFEQCPFNRLLSNARLRWINRYKRNPQTTIGTGAPSSLGEKALDY